VNPVQGGDGCLSVSTLSLCSPLSGHQLWLHIPET
jgi:hypothetical protein